ncbi:hypothetical protein ECE50_025345 [Chitinophaga sp. Mgbs1]|uniref:Uncharacterized protein n=1 Tax=Chitinophaga solisilvae TaxID=1233460 RepID=A0A433WLK4_9BACT|nr:hypothetical protein [Chitinophaga solisilvae]
MNFDDIKSAWNSEEDNSNIIVPVKIDSKKAALPVDKIRSNMRLEAIVQVAALMLMYFVPAYYHFGVVMTTAYYCVYGIAVAITAYYFIRFYFFYRRISNTELNSKDHIYAVYYDIKLNIEMYRSFTYALLMLALGLIITAVFFIPSADAAALSNKPITYLIMVMIVFTALIAIATEIALHRNYGRYLKAIKAILDEFREG